MGGVSPWRVGNQFLFLGNAKFLHALKQADSTWEVKANNMPWINTHGKGKTKGAEDWREKTNQGMAAKARKVIRIGKKSSGKKR